MTARGARSHYEEMLKEACAEANGVAYEYSRFSEEFNGMGTTIVGGVIKVNGNGYIINVGDSRAYLISQRAEQHPPDHPGSFSRGGSGRIRRDHPGTGSDSSSEKCDNTRARLGSDGGSGLF